MAWKILHCKLPIGSRLKCIMVNPINCPFCKKSEDMRHIFWGCSFAKKLWNSVFHYLPAIFWHNLNWKEALLGVGLRNNVIAESVRQTILLHIWRVRCKAAFGNSYDHQEFAILNLFYCLASIFTHLQADSRKSSTTTYQVQCIQHQVVQLIKNQQNGLLHSLQPLIRILINCN